MKLDDMTNNDKYRLAANMTEYHTIQKLIFLRIIIQKFMMMIRKLFHVKMYVNRTTTFIKAKFINLDDKTDIGKHRVAANIIKSSLKNRQDKINKSK